MLLNIGIIGAGKVGCSMGKYLTDAGIKIVGFYSKSKASAQDAADFTKTMYFGTVGELIKASDTLFLTTPDGALGQVWDCIAKHRLEGKVICHFSGSLSSDIFKGIGQTGASGCSVHPMYAFSDKYTSYRQLHTAALTMEGEQSALEKMSELFGKKLHHRIFTIKTHDKIKYHAAASFASNYLVGIMDISFSLLKDIGFSSEEISALIKPLSMANLQSVFENGTAAALTGPVERGDYGTVKSHMMALLGKSSERYFNGSVAGDENATDMYVGDENAKEVYSSLGMTLVSLAQRKNPDRDYTALKELFLKGI